jgi:hypothetical protein
MKRIVRRVQSLNERAAELTAAASQLPKRVAEMREVMTATTGQLQSLKTDIQANVADLVIHREDDFAAALAEITSHAPVLAEAGFLLDGLDIEVSPTQRVVVQLVRIGDAEPGEIEELIQKHHGRTTLRAILSAMLKARDVAATIRIDGLDYHQLLIGIGPVPIIRIGWRAATSSAPAPAPSAASTSWQPSVSKPLPGGSSFFGPPISSTTSFAPVPPEPEDEPAKPVAAAAPTAPPPLPPPSTDPLARFKVMPDLHRTKPPSR